MEFKVKKNEDVLNSTKEIELPKEKAPVIMAAMEEAMRKLDMLKKESEMIDFRKNGADALATGVATSLRQAVKTMDERREQVKSPYLKSCQAIDSFFRPVKKIADEIMKSLQDRQRAHIRAQMEAAAKLQAKADSIKVPEQKAIVQAAAISKQMAVTSGVQTETGSSSVKKFWNFEVDRPEVVPQAFLMVDTQKVRKAIDAGVRAIPGIRIFEDVDVLYRSSARR